MRKAYARYLELLGIGGRPRGLDGLRNLVRRHLQAVPFENIGKLLLIAREGRGRVSTLEEFLDGIEILHLGGTCYTANPFFAALLRELDYDADVLGADMSAANVHTALRVHMDGRDYHVDVGFAAPFRDPLCLDDLPAVVAEGARRYEFARERGGGVRVRSFGGDGQEGVGYTAHLPPRAREFFDPIVADSFRPQSTFLNCLRISRVFADYTLDLHDRTLIRHEGGQSVARELGSMEELRAVVREQFGMRRAPLDTAVAALERNTGRPLFAEGA